MAFGSEKRHKSQALHAPCMNPTCRCSHWLFTECFFLSALLKALNAADTISLPQYTFNTQPATIHMLHQSFSYQRPCAVGRHCFDDKKLFPECLAPLRVLQATGCDAVSIDDSPKPNKATTTLCPSGMDDCSHKCLQVQIGI